MAGEGVVKVQCAVFLAICCSAADGAMTSAQPGFLLMAEQKSGSIVVVDARKAGAPEWSWEWNAKKDPGLSRKDAGMFYAPSDCKLSRDGDTVLVMASGGNFAEVSLATGRAITCGRIGGNPHSITRLPGKMVYATASSVSHAVTVVDASGSPLNPDLQAKRKFPLYSAHGVEWDEKRSCLWALGGTNLVKFSWNEAQFDLKAERSFGFLKDGSIGGHDLTPDGKGGYFLTTGRHLLRFDPDRGTFAVVKKQSDIKAFSPDPVWGDAYTIVRQTWWTDRIIVVKDGVERIIGPYPGTKIYKARWMLPSWKSEGM